MVNQNQSKYVSYRTKRTMTYQQPEYKDRVIAELRTNSNITKVCENVGIVKDTFYRWCGEDDEFNERVKEARKRGIGWLVDKAHGIADEGDGAMVRWLLSRYDSETYGDKIQTNTEVRGVVYVDSENNDLSRDKYDEE